MVSSTAYAAIAIAIVIPVAIFAVYSTTLESEPAAPAVEEPQKMLVLSSFYPIEQFTSRVGGDKIDSQLVLPPGAEPHDWEPTVRDVQNMRNADVIVINGLGFETWTDTLHDVKFDGLLIDTSHGIDLLYAEDDHGDGHGDEREEEDDHGDEREEEDDHGDEREEEDDHGDEREEEDDHGDEREEEDDHGDEREEEDDHGDEREEEDDHGDEREEEDDHGDEGDSDLVADPHIWLNPVHVKVQVQHIADGLSEVDPDNAEYYRANAADYIEELEQLDSDIRMTLQSCSREFVAFHQAFSYFSAEYGLMQYTIVNAGSPHGEVSTRTLERVIETARQQNIDTIFTEEAADPRTAQVIADEIDGRVLTLSPLEIGVSGETYTSIMYHNLENLETALCQNQ